MARRQCSKLGMSLGQRERGVAVGADGIWSGEVNGVQMDEVELGVLSSA